jgi:hypothetical protein
VDECKPLLVGPTRAMADSDGFDATAVDVLFHPAVVALALSGGRGVTAEHYRDYLMDIAVKNIREVGRCRRLTLSTPMLKAPLV